MRYQALGNGLPPLKRARPEINQALDCDAPCGRVSAVLVRMVNMTIDLKWVIRNRIKEIGKQDYTWFFAFDGGGSITTESTWRIITADGIRATSEDNGHEFGLSAPLDVVDVAKKIIGQQTIKQYALDPRTGDLSLHFEDNCELQFLNLSSGYESWHIVHGAHEIICMGGGKLQEIENK